MSETLVKKLAGRPNEGPTGSLLLSSVVSAHHQDTGVGIVDLGFAKVHLESKGAVGSGSAEPSISMAGSFRFRGAIAPSFHIN